MVAAHHLAGWAATGGARVTAIAEPDPVRRVGRADTHGIRGYATLAEMLAAETLDAVDIVAPVGAHAALVRDAVEVGLPVMCQKPLTPDLASADRLIAALPPGARVMLHENWRWRRPYRRLKAALSAGEVPVPAAIEMRAESAGLLADDTGRLPALERQPFFAGLERLIVFELLIHHLDVLGFLFGPVTVRDAVLTHRCPQVAGEDRAEIRLTAGPVEALLVGDFMVPGVPVVRDRLRLGPGADWTIDGWTLCLPGRQSEAPDPETLYQESYTATIAHFVACLRSGAPFETDARHGRDLLAIVEEVYRAARDRPA